jgi:hypothetical protein
MFPFQESTGINVCSFQILGSDTFAEVVYAETVNECFLLQLSKEEIFIA